MTASADTRGAVLQRLTVTFSAAGLETPELDARLLLAHALGVEQLQLLTNRDAMIPTAAMAKVTHVVARRLAREPVSRIIGERWFYGRPFLVTPATLDPRPDSETLIEAACSLMRETGLTNDQMRVLDIGTGTGCLLLTMLCELPGACGIGTDISSTALAVATENSGRLLGETGGLEHVDWRLGADFEPVRGETFNLIISNPPYIPTDDIAGLAPDVRHFDPILALDGGCDGLDIYRRLTKAVPTYLSKGWIIFEVGAGQAPAVSDLLRSAFAPVDLDLRVFKDLAGVQRCVAASPRL